MARILEKNIAHKLRKKGKSINEISQELKMPKSTVSVWCRNIKLAPKQIERLANRQESGSYKGRMKFLERIRRERLYQVAKLRREGLREIGEINKRDLFIAGIAMYWSEGVTALSDDGVSFSNSDFRMLLFMLEWFKNICGVSNERFKVQIRVNQIHKSRAEAIKKFWSETLNIPPIQFTKTILIKTKARKIFPNPESYFGTVRIKVGQGTRLRRKINGWIEGLGKGIKLPA